ncbi:hypothetical protein ACFQE8_04080 [Salinirubellus sp. GCM10025818]|uniref:hypothetical protein n=1 Tax=Salinirubellus TaxID=2162630 RepID=UPI0030CCB1C5
MSTQEPSWWKINAGNEGTLKRPWLLNSVVSMGWSVGDPDSMSDAAIRGADTSSKLQLSKFLGVDPGTAASAMSVGDRIVAYAPDPVGELVGIGVVGPLTRLGETLLDPPHTNVRSVRWFDSALPLARDDLPDGLINGPHKVIPGATLEAYTPDKGLLERKPVEVDFNSVTRPPQSPPGFSATLGTTLSPGEIYTAAELRDEFDRSRTKGIEISYDKHGKKYLRLFSKPMSEYGDDLSSSPMRYVGERNPDDPEGDQVEKGGNAAIINATDEGTPMFLFEKESEDPVRHRFIGQVSLVDYDHTYRPTIGRREFDFYLRGGTTSNKPADSESPDSATEPADPYAPSRPREIDPSTTEPSYDEEMIEYISNKETQAEATEDHQEAIGTFRDWLQARGWDCSETVETDILAERGDDLLVVEIKSVNEDGSPRHLRYAIGQLLENSYREGPRAGREHDTMIAALAFSEPPADAHSGYFEYLQSWGIETLWADNDAVAGLPESLALVEVKE